MIFINELDHALRILSELKQLTLLRIIKRTGVYADHYSGCDEPNISCSYPVSHNAFSFYDLVHYLHWCKDNCADKWLYNERDIIFESEVDATLFVLTYKKY